MTDFTYLPADLWRDIAKFLSPKDHQALLLASQFFNGKVAIASSLLQPHYNRLYALDPSLPALLPNDNAKATIFFRKAAEKILACQNQEVKHLRKIPDDCLVNLHLEQATIEQLEKNSLILDEINSRIIINEINKNKTSSKLILDAIRLTRFPIKTLSGVDKESYIKKLGALDIISIISEIDLHAYFETLTELDINDNYMQSIDLTTLDKLSTLNCTCNNSLESLKLSNNLKTLNAPYNHLKVLDLSYCDSLETILCNQNQIEKIYFPKNGRILTLICDKNKIKSLDLSGLNGLANERLNIDFNPLEELCLEGVDPFIQKQYSRFQTELLFKKLLKNFHDAEKKQEIIQTMGPRYSYANCLKYLGFMQTSTIASEQLISAVVSATSFLPSYSVSSKEVVMDLEQENNLSHSNPLKRERDEDDADSSERPVKKRK